MLATWKPCSALHFAIYKRFKDEKFLNMPVPDATKIEIADFEDFGRLLRPEFDVSAADQPKRGAVGR
jgi:hypothetical protein